MYRGVATNTITKQSWVTRYYEGYQDAHDAAEKLAKKQMPWANAFISVDEASEVSAAAAALGRKGGSVKSDAKTKASRENAKKGGWPKGKPRKPKN